MITLGTLAPKNAAKDPFFSSVSMLLHGNGVDGSQVFTDSSSFARTISVSGNAKISTTQSKFGGASMFFDGTGDYAQFATNPSNAAYTVECWCYVSNIQGYVWFLSQHMRISPGSGGWTIQYTPDTPIITSKAVSLNTWTHLAFSCSSSTGPARFFVDGVLATTLTEASFTTPTGIMGLAIASSLDRDTTGPKFNGYIDDFRYTVGVARYTANFTPPTSAYPDS